MDIKTFLIFLLVGFLAQMIDGTLGMAYGVSGRTFLKSFLGLPSPLISAIIHAAELPVTLISGISHWRLNNVDKQKLIHLAIPGVIGGILGAWFLSGAGERFEQYINIYLILMGIIIILKAFQTNHKERKIGNIIYPLGFIGGFFDAAGGGGWGPIVTSTMIAMTGDVKKTIGSVNAAEFLVTAFEITTFSIFIKDIFSYSYMILAMILGGMIAAPLAASLCKKIPSKPLMFVVGLLIIALNIYNLFS